MSHLRSSALIRKKTSELQIWKHGCVSKQGAARRYARSVLQIATVLAEPLKPQQRDQECAYQSPYRFCHGAL